MGHLMTEIPGYRLVRPLGRGGMAEVHLAVQASLDREVALKFLAPALVSRPRHGHPHRALADLNFSKLLDRIPNKIARKRVGFSVRRLKIHGDSPN